MDFIFDDFPDKTLLKGFEGGAVFSAEKEGKFYLLEIEFSTFLKLLFILVIMQEVVPRVMIF